MRCVNLCSTHVCHQPGVGNFDISTPNFDQHHGAGYRQQADLSLRTLDAITGPGQSGNLFSPHFSDWLSLWYVCRCTATLLESPLIRTGLLAPM